MFDSFLNTIKNQTLLVTEQIKASASLNDLRPQRNADHASNKIRTLVNSGIKKIIPGSRSDETRNAPMALVDSKEAKVGLKWPVLVGDEKRWVSTPVIDGKRDPLEGASFHDSESDAECVLWQSQLSPRDNGEDEDGQEETLIDRFSRISSTHGNSSHRRNDREEIRRRLAMGIDSEEDADRLQSRKQSLQSRLQSNMNLQICFMNETASDGSDSEAPSKEVDKSDSGTIVEPGQGGKNPAIPQEPFCSLPTLSTFKSTTTGHPDQGTELDFFAQQAKLQIEARTALAQAKELARIQMQVERQQRKRSLISDLVRQNLEKVLEN